MRKWTFILILSVVTCVGRATSLKVSPGGFIVHDLMPGITYNLKELTGVKLSIYNDDDTTRTYSLSAHKPSIAGKWEKGYGEIPDPGWLWFESNEVTIAPRKVAYGNIFLRIPDMERYYNQRWVTAVGIIGKQEGGVGFGLGVYIRIQMETQSKVDIKEIPEGEIAFKPGVADFDNILPGRSQETNVIVYNNDVTKRAYIVNSLRNDKKRQALSYLTRSYELLPDSSWLELQDESFEIDPGGSFVLNLKISVPDQKEYQNKKWEEILFIEPENGLAGFLRIRIRTGDKGD